MKYKMCLLESWDWACALLLYFQADWRAPVHRNAPASALSAFRKQVPTFRNLETSLFCESRPETKTNNCIWITRAIKLLYDLSSAWRSFHLKARLFPKQRHRTSSLNERWDLIVQINNLKAYKFASEGRHVMSESEIVNFTCSVSTKLATWPSSLQPRTAKRVPARSLLSREMRHA